MSRKTDTQKMIEEQMKAHGIEFGKKYRDPASGYEGEVSGIFFYKHGCTRVCLRGVNKTTGEPADYIFDAPELVSVETDIPVPPSKKTGGPHDLTGPEVRR